jgi:cobalt-zinc-cadmium efflux system outer membrane protein
MDPAMRDSRTPWWSGSNVGGRWFLGAAFLAVLPAACGCVEYAAQPLTPQAVDAQLAPPAEEDLAVGTQALKQPLLEPVAVNLSDGLSPDEAAVLAVVLNPQLRAVRDQKAIAAAQLLQAGILPNPQLSAALGVPFGGGSSGNVSSLDFGLDWDVASLVTRAPELAAARARASGVDLEVAWREWQVAEGAKLHAHRLALADEAVTLAASAAKTREQVVELIQEGVELGERTALELATARAALKAAEVEWQAAGGQREDERLALNRALGLPADYALRPQEDAGASAQQPVPSAEEALAGIEDTRLDLVALRMGYESQEAKLRAAVRSQFPRIGVGLNAARDTDGVRTAGFGVTIDLPFFDSAQGRVAVEQATRQQLFDEYVARVAEARSDVARVLADIASTDTQLQTVEDSLPALEQLVSDCEKAVQRGETDLLSYYRQIDSLYATRRQALQLRGTLAELRVALELATGKYSPAAASDGPQPGGQTE